MKKPIIYCLYYSWYEEWSEYEFTHFLLKTQEDFQSDCIEILKKYSKSHIDNGGYIEGNKDNHKTWIGSSDLIELIAKHLPELGYTDLNDTFDTIKFGVFGSNILQDKSEQIFEFLGDDLTKEIIDYNDAIEKKMDERINQIS